MTLKLLRQPRNNQQQKICYSSLSTAERRKSNPQMESYLSNTKRFKKDKKRYEKVRQNLENSKVEIYNQTSLLNFCFNMKRKLKIFEKGTSFKTTKKSQEEDAKETDQKRLQESIFTP